MRRRTAWKDGVGQTSAATEQQMASLDEPTSTSQHLSEAAGKLAAVKPSTGEGEGGA